MSMSAKCPICSSLLNLSNPTQPAGDTVPYDCIKCGKFVLSGTLDATLPRVLSTDQDAEAKLSHALRRAQERAEPVKLTTDIAEAILKNPLPRPREQADLLIRWLANNVPGPGETLSIEYGRHGSIIGSKSAAGFKLILDHLFSNGLITGNQSRALQGGNSALATLSFEGWEYYEQLRQGGAVYKKAFMAMKFGDEDLTLVLNNVFKPSAKRAGFDLVKLDDVPKAGLIDDRLRVEIQSSDFIVADLSHDNLGAYWEAGYAEGLGKPVIYTCEKSKFASAKTHFDTNHHLTILWEASAPEAAGNDLVATIRATLPHLARLVDSDI
jgi:hypothetical protein